jgi:integrase/recombinase XerD
MTRLEQRGGVVFTCMGIAVVVILLITVWGRF